MPKKFERCVEEVSEQNKKHHTKYNPYAVCKHSMKVS